MNTQSIQHIWNQLHILNFWHNSKADKMPTSSIESWPEQIINVYHITPTIYSHSIVALYRHKSISGEEIFAE